MTPTRGAAEKPLFDKHSTVSAPRWRLTPHEVALRLIADRRADAALREIHYFVGIGAWRNVWAMPMLDPDTDAVLLRLEALDSGAAGSARR